MESAVAVERGLDAEISAHEAASRTTDATNTTDADNSGNSGNSGAVNAGSPSAQHCPQCGQWVSDDHDCPQARTHAALRDGGERWRAEWTPEEAEAFDTYGGVDHYDINAKLRNGQELDEHEAEVVRGLDSALERAPEFSEEKTLYRAFGLAAARGDTPVDQWVEEHFPHGSTTTLDAYTSVTPDHSVAESFSEANSEYTDGGVLMEVRTRQGGYTAESPEKEVLLRRGTRVEVVSSSEAVEINGKRFRKVVVAEKPAGASSTTHQVSQDFG